MTRFIELESTKGQAQALGNRASVYEAEGRLEEAVETYKESATMLEEIGESGNGHVPLASGPAVCVSNKSNISPRLELMKKGLKICPGDL